MKWRWNLIIRRPQTRPTYETQHPPTLNLHRDLLTSETTRTLVRRMLRIWLRHRLSMDLPSSTKTKIYWKPIHILVSLPYPIKRWMPTQMNCWMTMIFKFIHPIFPQRSRHTSGRSSRIKTISQSNDAGVKYSFRKPMRDVYPSVLYV